MIARERLKRAHAESITCRHHVLSKSIFFLMYDDLWREERESAKCQQLECETGPASEAMDRECVSVSEEKKILCFESRKRLSGVRSLMTARASHVVDSSADSFKLLTSTSFHSGLFFTLRVLLEPTSQEPQDCISFWLVSRPVKGQSRRPRQWLQ